MGCPLMRISLEAGSEIREEKASFSIPFNLVPWEVGASGDGVIANARMPYLPNRKLRMYDRCGAI